MKIGSEKFSRQTTFLRATAIFLALLGPTTPAGAVVPLVQDYLHGIDALTALAKVPTTDQAQYRQEHAEELDAAMRAVGSADDIYRYTLAVNAAIIFRYGHAVICNYDEETGPRIGQLIANHIVRLEKSNVPPNEARRATGQLNVDELVLGEILDEFPCPSGPIESPPRK
jgi:hypothetical protein